MHTTNWVKPGSTGLTGLTSLLTGLVQIGRWWENHTTQLRYRQLTFTITTQKVINITTLHNKCTHTYIQLFATLLLTCI